jgi:hypothetical protein
MPHELVRWLLNNNLAGLGVLMWELAARKMPFSEYSFIKSKWQLIEVNLPLLHLSPSGEKTKLNFVCVGG